MVIPWSTAGKLEFSLHKQFQQIDPFFKAICMIHSFWTNICIKVKCVCLCEYCLVLTVHWWLHISVGSYSSFIRVYINIRATVTSGVDDQINVIVAWDCCSMSQRTSLVYLTDIEIMEVSL